MSRPPGFAAFGCWLAVGVGLCVAVLTPFTIGPLVLPVALAVAAVTVWRWRSPAGAAGLLPGAGLVLLYVAFLNRAGPGDVCTTTATSQSCVWEYSPWPWLAAGAVFVAAGPALFLWLRRGRRPDGPTAAGRLGGR